MERLFDRLVGLLGREEDDPAFRSLLADFDDGLEIYPIRHGTFYTFSEAGFEIFVGRVLADTTLRCVDFIVFFIDVPSVREGRVKRFEGEFLDGVTASDSIASVRKKVAAQLNDCYAPHIPKLRYDFPGYSLEFDFHEPGGEQLAIASLKCQVERSGLCSGES